VTTTTRGAPAPRAPVVTEKAFQRALLDLLHLHGWRVWHDTVAWRSDRGWPDLVCAHPTHGLRFLELKRDNGALTPTQESWLADLTAAGAVCRVLRPRDLYATDTAERLARGER
jgi:hypothetical protein